MAPWTSERPPTPSCDCHESVTEHGAPHAGVGLTGDIEARAKDVLTDIERPHSSKPARQHSTSRSIVSSARTEYPILGIGRHDNQTCV